jgi:hypothetical protein
LLQESAYQLPNKHKVDKVGIAQDLLNTRNKYFRAMVTEGLNSIGFTYAMVGNPVAYALLSLATLMSLQKKFAPKMFDFGLFAKKGDVANNAPDKQQDSVLSATR